MPTAGMTRRRPVNSPKTPRVTNKKGLITQKTKVSNKADLATRSDSNLKAVRKRIAKK